MFLNLHVDALGGTVTTGGGDVTIKASGGTLSVNGALNAGSGTVRLIGGGLLNQSAAITAANLGVNAAGTILLTQNNAITGNVAIRNTNSGGSTAFNSTGAITLNTIAADGGGHFTATNGVDTQGNVTIGSGGAITLTQGITTAGTRTVRLQGSTVTGTGAISTANLGVRATTGAIDLQGSNAVTGTVALAAVTGGNNISFANNSTTSQLGQITQDGTLFAANANGISTSGVATVTLTQNGGTLAQAANSQIIATNLDLKGAGNFALHNFSNTVTTIAGNATGTKRFSNSAALAVGTVGATNGFTGAAGDVSLRAVAGAINLGQSINIGSGTLRLLADAGAVNQTGGTITAANLGVSAGTSISLGSTNAVAAGGSFAALAGAGNLAFINANGVKVDGISAVPVFFGDTDGLSAAGNNVILSAANGTFTQTAGKNITATGLELNGNAAYTLDSTTNAITNIAATTGTGALKFVNGAALSVNTVSATNGITRTGDVTLRTTAGNLAVNQAVNAGTGTVRLQSAGAVTQAAAGVITAANLGARGTSVDLSTNSNAVTSDVSINASAGTAKFKNNAGFNVGSVAADGSAFTATTGVSTNNQDITLNAGGALAVNQAVNAGTGTVRMQSTAAITQAAAGVITAANLGARGIAVDLSTAANVVSTNVGINASAGNVLYKSTPGFALGNITTDGTLFGTATAGLSAAGNNVTIESAGAVTQTTGNNITASGLLMKGAGAYTLTNTTNSVTNIAATTGAGAVKYVNAGALTVGTVAGVDGITRTGNVTLQTTAGNLDVNQFVNAGTGTVRMQSAGTVTQAAAGVITAANLGARGTAVDLSTAANVVSGNVGINASAGNVLYKSTPGFALGNITTDGTLFGTATAGLSAAGNNVTIESAGAVTQSTGNNITASGLLIKGAGAYDLSNTTNSVTNIASVTGAGAVKYVNAGALTVGTVAGVDGITRTGDVTLQTGGTLTQTAAVAAANLQLLGGQAVTLTNAGNNIASLSGNTAALSVTNTGALALGALTTAGALTLNTGGTVSQTGALTQTGGGAVNVTATAGSIKLTNAANDVSGTVNLSAAAGGVAFVNNNAAGIKVGDITAATTVNTTNPADIANFTASDAALTGVALLQARQGNIERSGATKIVADRAVLVAANRIGGATANDATLGVRVEGAAGASTRQVYLSTGAAQMANIFGPATAPLFYKNLMNGATALPSPANSAYGGVAIDYDPAATAAAAAANRPATVTTNTVNTTSPTSTTRNTNDTLRQAQAIVQIQQPKSAPPAPGLNGITTPQGDRASNQVSRDLLNAPKVEPITVPSCAPGAARPAAPGQCG
ncbi:MAG: S-layer family protein [Polaromonas sp.]